MTRQKVYLEAILPLSYIPETISDYLTLDTENVFLSQAVTELFLEKRIPGNLGDFAHMILLHEIYREVFLVAGHMRRPLAIWKPSAQGISSQGNGLASTPVAVVRAWALEALNTSASWRNAALDSIDVLHWAANAKIASSSGVEHPMVLHLHISRVILLVPCAALVALAQSFMTLKDTSAQDDSAWQQVTTDAELPILEWVQRDRVS